MDHRLMVTGFGGLEKMAMIPHPDLLEWGAPHLLYGLFSVIAIPIICWLIRLKERRRYASIGSGWKRLVHHSFDLNKEWIRTLLLCVTIAALILSLAQPRDGFEVVELPTRSKSLMIAVDVSRSMLATDMKPSRLERAIREILDLSMMWSPHELGLIIFAGQAYIHLPLTRDLAMVQLFAKSLSVDMISQQGTDLGGAITLAINNLKKNSSSSASTDLLIMTDGENHHEQVLDVAQQAKTARIRIFTMGFGSAAGAPIRLADGRYKQGDDGTLTISKLDEATLIKISQITSGHYVRSDPTRKDLESLYNRGLKSSPLLERNTEDLRRYHELYMWPGWLALICFVLSFIITPYTKSRPIWMMALLIALSAPLQSVSATPIPAAEIFDHASSLLNSKNLSSEDINTIESSLLQIISTEQALNNKHLMHAAHYNLFHLYLKKQNLKQAYNAIFTAYTVKDSHKPTLENLKWIRDLLKKTPPKPPDPQSSQQPSPSDQQPKPQQQMQEQEQSPQAQTPDPLSQKPSDDDQKTDPSSTPDPPPSPSDPQNPKTDDSQNTKETQSAAGSREDGTDDTQKPADQDDTMGFEQAESLFRELEENLEIYGRKHHGSQNNSSKDW